MATKIWRKDSRFGFHHLANPLVGLPLYIPGSSLFEPMVRTSQITRCYMFTVAPQPLNNATLTGLPTELHREIVNQLRRNEQWADLCALSLSCSVFRDIAQRALYSSIRITHNMRQIKGINNHQEPDYGSESAVANDEAALEHKLMTLASRVTEKRDLLRHVRKLTINGRCGHGCQLREVVSRIAHLFLDHLFEMTGLKKLVLMGIQIIKPDIYRGIIAVACHRLQEVRFDLRFPARTFPRSLFLQSPFTDSGELQCIRAEIIQRPGELSDFSVWFVTHCPQLTTLSLRGDILGTLGSIQRAEFRNLTGLDISSGSPHLAESLSVLLHGNPSIENLSLCISDISASLITLSEDCIPVLRSVKAPINLLRQLIPGRPITSVDSKFLGKHYKSSLVIQLIQDLRRYRGKAIEGFGITVSPRQDTNAILDNILDSLKSVERLELRNIPQDDEVFRQLASAGSTQLTDHPFQMALSLLSRIKSAGFTRLKHLTLNRDLQRTDNSAEWAAFWGLLAAVQDLIPSVVEFIVTYGRTSFFAKRVNEQRGIEDGGWFVTV